MKMVTYSICLSLLFSISISIYSSPSYAADIQPTELVNEVCNQTSNYTFCVESLYTDPRTENADSYELAYVAFRLAFFKANSTNDLIAKLLKNNTNEGQSLQTCSGQYENAVFALEEAYGDLDSESFDLLLDLSNNAAQAAADCQAALKGTSLRSSLTAMNEDFKVLCEICVAVSKLFSIS